MIRRLLYLTEKELKQMMRNILLPIIFVLLPLGMINMIPRIATQEVQGLHIAAVDNDHSTLSQRLVQKISASSYFELQGTHPTYQQALGAIESGDADIIVEIQPDFERDLIRTGTARVQIAGNAVNGMKGGLGSSYAAQIVADYAAQLREEAGQNGSQVALAGMDVKPRFMFNVDLDYKVYMIPALICMILILIVGFLPALNIVGEKEKGTIEQINVTPIGRMEFVLSKMIPYWLVGLFMLTESMLVARGVHGIVPAGSIGGIFLFATVFIMLVSSLGLIVSNYSSTTQQAALVMFFFLIIFLLMSGLLTPVQSMPDWAQIITLVNPLRYLIDAMRSLYIRGSSVADLSTHLIVLCAMTVVSWTVAIWSYKKSS